MTEHDFLEGADSLNVKNKLSINERWFLFGCLLKANDKETYIAIYSALTRGSGSGSWTMVATDEKIKLRNKLQAKYRERARAREKSSLHK